MAVMYVCAQCGFSTESESDLNRHIMRLHENEIE